MRLFLIPISTRRALIYSRPLSKELSRESSITDRITSKAAETWAKWEEADKGWRKHLVVWGNRVQQQIPFEEWGLKSIPALHAQRNLDKSNEEKMVDVLFPGNAIRAQKVHSILQKMATERQDLHRKRMWWSLVIAPLTAPIGLIPLYVFVPGRWGSSTWANMGKTGSPISHFSILSTGAGRIGEVSHLCSSFVFLSNTNCITSFERLQTPRVLAPEKPP